VLSLARDRVGIKPLYYYAGITNSKSDIRNPRSEIFLFASEAKAILASGLIKGELDREALHQFLTFLWVPDPNTLFQNIKTVLPGHVVTVRGGEVCDREWWDLSFDEIEQGKAESWWRE